MKKLVIVDDGPDILKAVLPRLEDAAQVGDASDTPEGHFGRMKEQSPRGSDSELWGWVTPGIKQRADGKWIPKSDPALRAPGAPTRNDMPSADRWATLPKIDCPTLLLRGADSDFLTARSAERMVREIPNCEFVEIPRASHRIPLENPEAFVAALRGFV